MSIPDSHCVPYKAVLDDLMLATHCHSCDEVFPVALRGYSSAHCTKGCWKSWDKAWNYDLVDCAFGLDCKICNEIPYTLANSTYHRPYKCMMNSSGCVWPMGDSKRPCYNPTIREKLPIKY
jgi:hypothetical protein